MLCQAKVNEENSKRKVISLNHKVFWFDVTIDVVLSM